MSKKKNVKMEVKWPVFDPGPSCDFATEVFNDTRIAGILIGRFAVWAWVSDPAAQGLTKDLDFAIRRKDLPAILSYVEECGHKIWELSIGGINVADEDKRIKVDFIHRHSEEWGNLSPLFEHAVYEAAQQGRTAVIGNRSFLLASAEHMVAMKLATMEPRDDQDAKRILETVDEIDIAKLRELVSAHLGALGKTKLENLLREVGHPDARKRKKYIS
jgi:hypothetical protein